MDRVNFQFPGRRYENKGPWCHVDQTLEQGTGRLYVQAYLTLSDALDEEKDPGNRFYEGSHKIFEEFFSQSKRGNNDGWILLSDEQRIELKQKCPLVKPTYPKGSVVLWDSRTVHSPSSGTDFARGRFCIYFNYCPLWEKQNDQTTLKKKRQAFLERRATTHRPVPQKLFAETARTYGRPANEIALLEIDPVLLLNRDEPTETEKYLFGFKQYNGREGCLLGKDWLLNALARKPLLKFDSPFESVKNVQLKKRLEEQQKQKLVRVKQASEEEEDDDTTIRLKKKARRGLSNM
jgi:hypothetical protein